MTRSLGHSRTASIAVREHPFWLGGEAGSSSNPLEIRNPFDGSIVGRTFLAGDAEFERAAEGAVATAPVMRAMPAYQRAAILVRASTELTRRRDELARTLAGEVGKA